MTCPPAIEHSLYADGALPPDEARALELHMQPCDRCRGAVDRMAAENSALSAAFHSSFADLPEWTPSPLPTPAGLLRNVGATVALLFAPAWLISRHGPLRFVVPALLSAIELSQTSVAAVALLLAIGAAVSWLGLRRVRGLALILFFLAAIAPAHAITWRAHGPVALIAAGETVNDSVFAAGEVVRVEGVIAGDLFAFARRIEIRGTVRGHVYAFAKETEIAGALNRNLYVWAESTRLDPDAQIKGKVIAAGESATVAATVGGPFRFYGERLTVENGARIAGPVTSEVTDEGARFQDPWFYVRRLAAFAAALLAAFVAARLAPMAVQESVLAMAHWWRSLAAGVAAAMLGPIAILVAAITVIGIPVAAVLLALLALSVYAAKVLVGDFAGRILLPGRSRAIQLTCGLALIFIAIELPFGIGGAVWTATALVGLGAFTSGARRYYLGIFR
jgi:hypothetical protein